MKVLSFEFGSILLAIFLFYLIYSKNKKIEELKDTINVQHEAIVKQKVLIEMQNYYLSKTDNNNIFNKYQ